MAALVPWWQVTALQQSPVGRFARIVLTVRAADVAAAELAAAELLDDLDPFRFGRFTIDEIFELGQL